MGRYLEDFTVGERLITNGRTVTEGDVMAFAGLVGDWNPVHVDAHFAAASQFGERIAHGPLTLAMTIGLASQLQLIDGTVVALLHVSWDFHGPVRFGDTIEAEVNTLEVKPSKKPDRGRVTLELTVRNQKAETIQVGRVVLLMKKRPAA